MLTSVSPCIAVALWAACSRMAAGPSECGSVLSIVLQGEERKWHRAELLRVQHNWPIALQTATPAQLCGRQMLCLFKLSTTRPVPRLSG